MMMQLFARVTLVTLVVGCASRPAPVLLVTLDTTRADHLGCYGHAAARTPNLDALAARGARFSHAYSAAPLTIPSHSTLMTGLYPPHHGVRDNGDQRLGPDALTLAERLQAAGYRTAAATAAFVTTARWGFDQGFDRYDDELPVPGDAMNWTAERPAEQVIGDALDARAAGADFLWVHLFEAHAPYRPPPAYRDMDPYDGEIAAADAALGRLLAVMPLETLIVVAGDHGEGLGDGGEAEHGLLLGDSTVRVPLILAGPGVEAGLYDKVVSLADVMPTVLRLVGLPVAGVVDGQDLFIGKERPVYAETYYGADHFGWAPLTAAIGAQGRVVRGARDVVEGEADAAQWALLEESKDWTSALDEAPATLDESSVQQLAALGYLTVSATSADGADPRDAVSTLAELRPQPGDSPAQIEARLRATLAAFPANRDAGLRLASMLAGQGRGDEALAALADAWMVGPDSTTALLTGGLWMQRGDPAEALSWYRLAAARDPFSPEIQAGAVEALFALGELDEAQAEADLAMLQTPDHPRLLAARALLAVARGEPPDRWAPAIDALASARPQDPGLLLTAARLASAQGDDEAAVDWLRAELSWRPANMSARMQLYGLLMDNKRAVEAYKLVRPLADHDPDDARANALAASALVAAGRPDKAAPYAARCAGDPACPVDSEAGEPLSR